MFVVNLSVGTTELFSQRRASPPANQPQHGGRGRGEEFPQIHNTEMFHQKSPIITAYAVSAGRALAVCGQRRFVSESFLFEMSPN